MQSWRREHPGIVARIVSLTGPWVRPILVQRADDDGLLQAIEFVGADLLMDVISGP
jgi:hypothetical protein